MAPTTATLRFGHPDLSVSDEERCLFILPAPKDIVNVQVELMDVSKSPNIVQGAKGLDVQGFTYIKHHSAICDGWRVLSERNAEDVYFPEVEQLLCKTTGASRAAVVNSVIRSSLPVNQENDHSFVSLKGSKLDQTIAELPKDVPSGESRSSLKYRVRLSDNKGVTVSGRLNAIEPNRKVHMDYSLKGVRVTARYLRKDIKNMAQQALDAEGAGGAVPRYGMYSVWRPLKPVKRDPLVVCDWRTVDQEEIALANYWCPSEICGEYLAASCMMLPPKDLSRQKWYWMPEQTPDDVLIIKIGDTQSDLDGGVAGGCPHASPLVRGTEDVEEARSSIEVRVLAFW